MKEALSAIENEISLISETRIDNHDLEKIKNKIESNMIFSNLSVLNKAMNLGYYELLGDVNLWNDELGIYKSITREDIRNTAGTLLKPEVRNILFYNKQKRTL